MEVAVYGLPVRMPHWSFGVRYIYQLVQHRMGHSRLFEVVFPGNPGRAYLAGNNSLQENTLVTAHVLGHADFAKNNSLFKRSQEQVGYRIVEQAAAHARQIGTAVEEYGQTRVEQVLDAALALEAHIDPSKRCGASAIRITSRSRVRRRTSGFQKRFENLPGSAEARRCAARACARSDPAVPRARSAVAHRGIRAGARRVGARHLPRRARGVVLFLSGVRLPDHERGLGLVLACAPAARGGFPAAERIPRRDEDALRRRAAARRRATGVAGHEPVSPRVLDLGKSIVAEHGLERAFQIRAEDDDFSFIRNHLTQELAEELKLFRYERNGDGSVKVLDHDVHALRETVLAPKYNFGAPAVLGKHIANDGSLTLFHEHETDGRGLDLDRAERVLDYLQKVWRRPIRLETVDARRAGAHARARGRLTLDVTSSRLARRA